MTRGVLYITFPGKQSPEKPLERSIASLKQFHPDLPIHVERLQTGDLLDKSRMLELTPFDHTLYLDADTVVLGKLDFGFEKSQQFNVACCICECPWARRYACFTGDEIEYNTGVLFFTREIKPVFDLWKKLARQVDSAMLYSGPGGRGVMEHNDQAGFAMAIQQSKFNPFVLPNNWNFRPGWTKTIFGEMKIWHDYNNPPVSLTEWNRSQLAAPIPWSVGEKRGKSVLITCTPIG